MGRRRKTQLLRKLTSQVAAPALGLTAAAVIRGWTRTLDYRVAYYDPRVDPVHPQCRRRYLFLVWHEYMLFSVVHRGHCQMTVLASQNRDAEFATHAANHLGWGVVRGSSSRGGVVALRRMMREQDVHLNFTPDGPRGPRRQIAPGAVYLSAKLGMPIVCCGYAFDRPWRAKSWDRFAIPRPFSRARAVIGPALEFPKGISREDLSHARGLVQSHLLQLTAQAEQWAQTGEPFAGEMPMLPRRPAPAMRRPQATALPPCRYVARVDAPHGTPTRSHGVSDVAETITPSESA